MKEILELVYEVGEKTNSYVSYEYDTRTKVLMVVTDKDVLTVSEGEYQQKNFEKIQNCLKELIAEGDAGKND